MISILVRTKRPIGPKPHVMHRQCNNNNDDCDVDIVFSAQCHVSKEWAQYISNLMQNHGYSNVFLQDVETLSLLATKIHGKYYMSYCASIATPARSPHTRLTKNL